MSGRCLSQPNTQVFNQASLTLTAFAHCGNKNVAGRELGSQANQDMPIMHPYSMLVVLRSLPYMNTVPTIKLVLLIINCFLVRP